MTGWRAMVGGLTFCAATVSHADAACGKDPGCDPSHPYLIAWHALPEPPYPVWRRVIRLQADESNRDLSGTQGSGTAVTLHYQVQVVTLNRSQAVYAELVEAHGREHVDSRLNDPSLSRVDMLHITVTGQGPSQAATVQVRHLPTRSLAEPAAYRLACPTAPGALPCPDAEDLLAPTHGTARRVALEQAVPVTDWGAGRPFAPALMEAVLQAASWQHNLRGARLFTGPEERGPLARQRSKPLAGSGAQGASNATQAQHLEITDTLPLNVLVVDSQIGNGGGRGASFSTAMADDSVQAVLHRVVAFDEQPRQAFLQTVQVCARGKAASGMCL